ncbi:MAG: hypothetical protein II823_06430 [Kiritimatiellae bacterium]|nr:hypothetical protein [Kiritimatiellia bacterium]
MRIRHGLMLAAAVATLQTFCMTDTERQYLHNLALRPRCESRKQVVVGGTTNIVEVWRRGGYEWTQTNAVQRVIGQRQTNTFEQKLEEARAEAAEYEADAKTLRDMRKAAKRTEKNLSKILKAIEQAKKKAESEDEAQFYELLEGIISEAMGGEL